MSQPAAASSSSSKSSAQPTSAAAPLIDAKDHASSRKRKLADHNQHQPASASSVPPSAIFSPHLAGQQQHQRSGGGVYVGGRTTNTKQSSTLFVTNVDPQVTLEQVAALFQNQPGFFAFRNVRRMCFVDFHSINDATQSMRKYQNYLFPQLNPTAPGVRRLMIDYDKDDRSKRDSNFSAQVARAVDESEFCELIEMSCAACAQFCLKLRIPAPKTFATLTRRAIDQSLVIETSKYLTEIQLGKGEERAIKRTAGVELQYRLLCKSCQLPVAYSSQPFTEKMKHLFVIDNAMCAVRKEIRAGKMIRGGQEKFVVSSTQVNKGATTSSSSSSSSTPSISAATPSNSSAAATSTTPASSDRMTDIHSSELTALVSDPASSSSTPAASISSPTISSVPTAEVAEIVAEPKSTSEAISTSSSKQESVLVEPN